ncbi:MAG: MFS transporter [Pseudomonadota bacterium]|nr:MFS transporter [Pseudomonadota bacterium]
MLRHVRGQAGQDVILLRRLAGEIRRLVTKGGKARPGQAGSRGGAKHHWFITGLGVGQIVSWGSFYYSFPLIAEPMGRELGLSKPDIYLGATAGLALAGLVAYPVGAAIDKGKGRVVMAFGSAAGGLLLLGWSRVSDLAAFYLLLAGLGIVQAMTLYEPAFAVVARRFGAEARKGITALTLWGGFASTVFVPLIQWLLDGYGWRGALVALGVINLGFCVALYSLTINPKADSAAMLRPEGANVGKALEGRSAVKWAMGRPVFWALLVANALFMLTHSGLIFHLYPMLLERGYDTTTVVAAIAIFGPSQVAGRVVIWLFAAKKSIRAIGMVTTLLFPLGLVLLYADSLGFWAPALFAVIYGAANGIFTIVRGLAAPEMLTREAYGAINGALAAPATVMRAVAPLGAAVLWSAGGSYELVLMVAIAGALLTAVAFWVAAASAKITAMD